MRSPKLRFVAVVLSLLFAAAAAHAIPALQLGPGSGDWQYVNGTWVTNDDPLNLLATANATMADGGNGDYAWDPAGSSTQTAYLVVSGDAFDITIQNDGGSLTMIASGFGTPPTNDPNSLAPHGQFPNYYEVYEFNFDGALTTISNTMPGTTGTGMGYEEYFDIDILSYEGDGIHFDLFTVSGDGVWNPLSLDSKDLVKAFAPWSHDASFVPEPSAALLFGLGALVVSRRTRRA